MAEVLERMKLFNGDVLDQLSGHVKRDTIVAQLTPAAPEHVDGRLSGHKDRKSTQKQTKQSVIDKLSFRTRKQKTKGVAAEYTEGPRRGKSTQEQRLSELLPAGSDEGSTDSVLPPEEITVEVYAPPTNGATKSRTTGEGSLTAMDQGSDEGLTDSLLPVPEITDLLRDARQWRSSGTLNVQGHLLPAKPQRKRSGPCKPK
eukprot:GHVQ01041382.1.p1 GENE.GHVQ01041382.1~~GHVQ01041382.1.p1  ORF type:complete len:201 (-),score=24.15 GHVQ01041382.1:172-774(-)